MLKVELVEVDDSLAVILPAGLLAQWRLAAGDTIFLIDTPDGLILSPSESESGDQAISAEANS